MNAATLKALKASIAKYRRGARGLPISIAGTACPLCALFFEKLACNGCPVRRASGQWCCDGTPYRPLVVTVRAGPQSLYSVTANTPELRKAVKAELDFLVSLLPKEGHRRPAKPIKSKRKR